MPTAGYAPWPRSLPMMWTGEIRPRVAGPHSMRPDTKWSVSGPAGRRSLERSNAYARISVDFNRSVYSESDLGKRGPRRGPLLDPFFEAIHGWVA